MSEIVTTSAITLDTLAVQIRQEVEAAEADFQSAVAHAIRAGELLIEAKAAVDHGGWLPWLEANFPKSPRSAQGYMRLARRAEDAQALAHLGVERALKQLAAPRDERHDDEVLLRRVQHEDVEDELRRLFVRGEWRQPGGIADLDAIPDVQIAWAVLGVTLYHLDKANAPADFGYADLDEYVDERLPDISNAWRGLEFEMACWEHRGGAS